MACLLQSECNFLHRFFRCKLPVEVVDIEVKITSMEGCTFSKLHPHPNIVKKMKTFLEVENKMGPIIPALVSQFRPPPRNQS